MVIYVLIIVKLCMNLGFVTARSALMYHPETDLSVETQLPNGQNY